MFVFASLTRTPMKLRVAHFRAHYSRRQSNNLLARHTYIPVMFAHTHESANKTNKRVYASTEKRVECHCGRALTSKCSVCVCVRVYNVGMTHTCVWETRYNKEPLVIALVLTVFGCVIQSAVEVMDRSYHLGYIQWLVHEKKNSIFGIYLYLRRVVVVSDIINKHPIWIRPHLKL